MTVQELVSESHRIAKEHGWWDTPDGNTHGEKIALMHSELSEALEEIRNGKPVTEVYFSATGKPEGVPVELADVIIRVGDYCGRHGIDLHAAVAAKMKYNESRPYRHGNKAL